MSDGHVVKDKVELSCASLKLVADVEGDFLSLLDEVLGLVVGYHILEHLIGDTRNDLVVVVETDLIQNLL